MTRIQLDGLSKTYAEGAVDAIRDLTLTIESGEFVCIVGPSGSGKSTTLRLLAGLETPTAGTICFDDESVEHRRPADRNVAMVFQNYALYPHMSVRENLGYGLKHSSTLRSAARQQRVDAVATQLEITDILDARPDSLSGGQRQRVALGRAIAREPDVFLLDEPLSNLDASLRTRMRHEIQSLHEDLGITTVYVTHDQKEAMTMADRVVIMRDGQIEMSSPTETVYNHPSNRFVAEFIGSPSMNMLPCQLESTGPDSDLLHSAGRLCSIDDHPTDTDRLLVGVRPEHVELERGSSETGIAGTVSVTEYQGKTSLIHVDIGDEQCIARTSPGSDFSPGSVVTLTVDAANCYLFDPETERLLIGREHAPAT